MPFDHAGFVVPTVKTNQEVEILTIALDLIRDPNHWIKGHSRFVNLDGIVQRCAVGAIDEAAWQVHSGSGRVCKWVSIGARNLLRSVIGMDCIEKWNDAAKHREVIAAFNKAITLGMMKIG